MFSRFKHIISSKKVQLFAASSFGLFLCTRIYLAANPTFLQSQAQSTTQDIDQLIAQKSNQLNEHKDIPTEKSGKVDVQAVEPEQKQKQEHREKQSPSQRSQNIPQQKKDIQPEHEQQQNIVQEKKVQEKALEKEEQQKQTSVKKNKMSAKKLPYKQISEIPQFSVQQWSKIEFNEEDYVVIIADLPYNSKFQQEILAKVRNILRKRNSNQHLQVYRVDIRNSDIKNILSDKFGAGITEQTILILKNPYEKGLVSINFDMIVRSPQILPVFLSDLNVIKDHVSLEHNMKNLSPYQSFLIFIVDPHSPEYAQNLLSAKYIQMQLQIHHLQNMKLVIMDQELAKTSSLIKNPKLKSMHLVRKSNEFTYKTPNRFLFDNTPFLVLQNISLFDKKKQVIVQKYLNKIQTFSSMSIDSPFVCYVTIDRNKISPTEERQIFKVFSNLKKQEHFPHVSFIVKFAEVPYRGSQQQQFSHKRWSVMVANVDQLTKETLVHQIKNISQAKKLGINEQNWQKKTHQYLYREPQLNQERLKQFIESCLEGSQPYFYKTEKKTKFQKLNKITGENFEQEILKDRSQSHWLFEYSEYCSSCQMMAPLIENFAEIVQMFPDLKSEVHGVNCDKNRLKGQLYSPYTPSLSYFSKKWGNKWPIRYPLMEFINSLGIKGMYDFSEITESLGEVDLNGFQRHIKQVQENKKLLGIF